jgi:predicted permease
MLSKLRTALSALLRKSEVERELDEELRYHIERQTEQNIRLGMSPEEAQYAAQKAFGGVEQAKERSRDARGVRWIEELRQDLRYGARMLLKNSGFTLIAVITLALGIGANTIIFSVVNGVLLRPLPYHDPDRLMAIRETRLPETEDSQVSPGNYLDWRKQNTVFASLEAVTVNDFNLVGVDDPERIRGMLATHGFLSMLGMRPQIGRDFLPEEDRLGHNRVAILSYGLWQRRFGGDPNILGRAITLDDQVYTVIGALPPNSGLRFRDTDVWTPLAITAEQAQQHDSRFLFVCGRLKPGVTPQDARLEMSHIAEGLANEYPDSNTGWNVKIISLLDYAAEWAKQKLLLLLGAVAFVLLIACANVANLLMARAAARRKELAVRAALGAGRWRIVRQLLAESILLSLAGGIAGVIVANWGVKLLLATSVMNEFKVRVIDISLDGRMLVFNLAVVLLTGCVVGIVPALQASKPNLNETLNEGGRGSTGGRRQQLARDTLIALEVAMSMVLLVGAGLMVRSFIGLQQVDPGFNPRNVRTVSFSLPTEKYPDKERQASFFAQLIEKVASLPGVQAAGAACAVPFSYGHFGAFEEGFRIMNQSFKIEGWPSYEAGREPRSDYSSVSPDYFKAIGIPLLRGRYFTDRDTKGASRVAIINNTMARMFFPDEDPIGKRIHLTGGLTNGDEIYREIVGVVGDVKYYSLDQETSAQIYEPYTQQTFPFMTLVLRADGDPAGLNEAIRREILELDREQPVVSINMLDRLVSASTAERQSLGLLFGTFAAVAMGLAAVGLYGVMSYMVARRTQEIGIRMALGARRPNVLWLILRHGARLALCGVAIGILAAWAVTRLLINLLYGVSATDPLTFIGVSLLLIGVALLACYLPARRATKVDPMVALRCD